MNSRSLLLCSLAALASVGCSEGTDDTKTENNQNSPQIPTVEMPSISNPGEMSPHATQLANAVQQSQARLASSRSDICPKLIEFTVGVKTTFRTDEVMRRQSCKYFLYPKVGNRLNVVVSNSNMEALLVQPQLFDFKNGSYEAKAPGKHVLEIRYKDHHGGREPEKYNISVTKI